MPDLMFPLHRCSFLIHPFLLSVAAAAAAVFLSRVCFFLLKEKLVIFGGRKAIVKPNEILSQEQAGRQAGLPMRPALRVSDSGTCAADGE
jgi:hypothetical protein